MNELRWLFPSPRYEQHFRQYLQDLYHEWHDEWEATQPKWEPVNIRFEHNPNWRNEFWSITSAREGNHWVWKATRVLWVAAGGAWQPFW